MGKPLRLFLILIALVSIVLVCLLCRGGLFDQGMLGEITDPGEYSKIMEEAEDNSYLNHFPSDIPASAEYVRFHFHPSVFQGGTALQLRVRLPSDEVEEIRSSFNNEAESIFRAQISEEEAASLESVRIPYFYTTDDGVTEWPDGFEHLVFGTVFTGSEDFPSNHGLTYGISISVDDSEVVYWYEDW
jgi:hypothetical protein